MNLVIEPLHKEEASRLMLILSISLASLLEEKICSREEIASYVTLHFPDAELRKLDSEIQNTFGLLSCGLGNSGENVDLLPQKVYLNSLEKLKSLPLWPNVSDAWVSYSETGHSKKGAFMTLRFSGTAEAIKITCMISLGLAHVLKNGVISVDDAEILLFKPYLLKMFESVDKDVREIIELGTYLEDVDFFELDLNEEIQRVLDLSLVKLKRMRYSSQ